MKRFYNFVGLATLVSLSIVHPLSYAAAQTAPVSSQELSPIATSRTMSWGNVIPVKNGRLFVQQLQTLRSSSPQLGVFEKDRQISPYPNSEWNKGIGSNSAKNDAALQKTFLTLNGLYLKAGNTSLWVIDAGLLNPGKEKPKGAKLIQIDITTNTVTRVIPIQDDVLHKGSVLSQIRVKNNHAYIADSGVPALLVIDLDKGTTRRILENHPSLSGNRPLIINNQHIHAASVFHALKNVNSLALSPDETLLYYAPTTGPLYLIRTQMIDDPSVTPIELNESMMLWYNIPSSNGMTISSEGTIYISDIAHNSIISLSPDRHLTTLLSSPKLQWPGHLFLSGKTLYIPVTQTDNILLNHHGKNEKMAQSNIYKIDVPTDASTTSPNLP